MRGRGPEAISPTAHYTSYVWARNGLSHPALLTRRGRMMFEALRPAMSVSGVLGGPTLEAYLLARHRAIDMLLGEAIEKDGVCQVLELACGLSARGWRFTRQHPHITYIEADLPGMAERKRRALARIAYLPESHRVASVDVLQADGEGSLAQLTQTLDPDAGLVIITEGLLGYLGCQQVQSLWSRIASQLAGFHAGRYLADIQLASEAGVPVHLFRAALGAFVGGPVVLAHHSQHSDAERALRQAGFAHAAVTRAVELAGPAAAQGPGARLAHVAQADVQASRNVEQE